MGIVLKLVMALRSVLDVVSTGKVECRCGDGHVCRICEARLILQDSEQIVASGSLEGTRPRRKIQCITTGRIFDSLKDAADTYGIVAATISKACKGQLKYAGKMGNQKLEWRYYDEHQ